MKKRKNLCLALLATTALAILCGCGGVQSGPEKVARAYIEAIVAGDCDKAAGYMFPGTRDEITRYCGSPIFMVVSARIDDVVVRKTDLYTYHVALMGSFEVYDWMFGASTSTYCSVMVEKLGGEYYTHGVSCAGP